MGPLAVAGTVMALLALAPAPGSAQAGRPAGATAAGDRAFTSSYTFLADVSCPAASFCMAVGAAVDADNRRRTLAERWDGTAWHIVPTLNQGGSRDGNELWSVSCASATRCMAVGDAQNGSVPLAEEWNGAAWALLHTPVPRDGRDATLASVSCPVSSRCVAAGVNVRSPVRRCPKSCAITLVCMALACGGLCDLPGYPIRPGSSRDQE